MKRLYMTILKSGVLMKLMFVASLLCLVYNSDAQLRYSVTGGFHVAAYPYLYEYANEANTGSIVQLTLNDVTISQLRVKMKLHIKGPDNLEAHSKEDLFNEPIIELQGGVPYMLTSDQLAYYFKFENLDGIDLDTYGALLKEARHEFSFEVFDDQTGRQLSDKITGIVVITLNNEPLLRRPANNYNVKAASNTHTSMEFEWSPAARATEYEITLIELTEGQEDLVRQFEFVADAPAPSPGVIYRTTTSSTSLLYDPGQPYYTQALEAGKSYAWRVRALYKPDAINAVSIYKNDGYSQPWKFTYQGNCADLPGWEGEAKSSNQINLNWVEQGNHTAYQVSYRKKTEEDEWNWVEERTSNNYYNITQLEANTAYEIKIAGVCETVIGEGPLKIIQTLEEGVVQGIECGKEPEIDISNQELKEIVVPDNIVFAGDFPVTLMNASGNAQGWNGKGYVGVPLIGGPKWELVFTNIAINKQGKLIRGFLETTYDPTGKNIKDVTAQIDELLNDIGEKWDELTENDEYRERIEALVEGLKDKLPDEVVNQLNNTHKKYEEAVAALRAAEAAYNNTPDEPADAKEKAKEQLEKAKEEVEQAKKAWMEALEESKEFIENFGNWAIEAAKQKANEDGKLFPGVKGKLKTYVPSLDNEPGIISLAVKPTGKTADNLRKEIFGDDAIATAGSADLAKAVVPYNKTGFGKRYAEEWWRTKRGTNNLIELVKKGFVTKEGESIDLKKMSNEIYSLQKKGIDEEEIIRRIKNYLNETVDHLMQKALSGEGQITEGKN